MHKIHHYARDQVEAIRAARKPLDHAANGEGDLSDLELIADLEVEPREHSGIRKRAAITQHLARVAGPTRQSQLAVKRKLLPHASQLDHGGRRARVIHG